MESLVKYDSDEEVNKPTKRTESRASRERETKPERGSRRHSHDDSDSTRSEDERKASRRDSKKRRSRSRSRKRERRSTSRSKHGKKKRHGSRDSRKKDRRSPRRERRRSRERDERKHDRDRVDRHKEKLDHRRRHRSRDRSPDRSSERKERKSPIQGPSTSVPHVEPNDSNDDRNEPPVSNSTSALRKAEAINRLIERRAQEKRQQLQKLGIEIPALMNQQQQQIQQQLLLLRNNSNALNANSVNVADNTQGQGNTANADENLTLNLSNFVSPVLANAKYTEQMQKKKLIWGAKKAPEGETTATNNKWEQVRFSQDNDGRVASKFLRLMGKKNAPTTTDTPQDDGNASTEEDNGVKQRKQMFSSMEQQYEIARQTTHTMRGMGFGFGSQSRPC